jgi:hypothetical protein
MANKCRIKLAAKSVSIAINFAKTLKKSEVLAAACTIFITQIALVTEAEWNRKLQTLAEARLECERQRSLDRQLLDLEKREKIVTLVARLPWGLERCASPVSVNSFSSTDPWQNRNAIPSGMSASTSKS